MQYNVEALNIGHTSNALDLKQIYSAITYNISVESLCLDSGARNEDRLIDIATMIQRNEALTLLEDQEKLEN
jgi:hypothetical protein